MASYEYTDTLQQKEILWNIRYFQIDSTFYLVAKIL